MSVSNLDFSSRRSRIVSKHNAMSGGYSASIRNDGLIFVEPKRRRMRFPIRSVLMIVATVFLFKGYVLAALGANAYDARISALEAGTSAEQVTSYIMMADPVTQQIATLMSYLR